MRKKPGEGILPKIDDESAALFEDTFVVLIEFGEQTFQHYVSQKSAREQEIIYDTYRLFGLVMRSEFTDKE